MRETESIAGWASGDERKQTRQFWLRVLLIVGILWGFLPFVMTPFITRAANDTFFDIFASVLNSLTILPACALAFWHRRVACVWLTVNAVVLAIALAGFIQRTRKFDTMMIVEVVGPVLFAILLDILEILRWPPAIEGRPAKVQPL
ncbi:MAG TPA: hypothetical protein VF730_04195 [Terracidiphilus sp.]